MPPSQSFLATICAHAEDDLPRLVYADWLEEQGDSEHAEFIRLQIAADRGDADANTPSARARLDQLHAQARQSWCGELRALVLSAAFHRGLIEHVVLPARDWMRFGEQIRTLAPIRGLTLLRVARVLPGLFQGDHLRGIHALHLTGARLGDAGVALLADCPQARDLRTLKLGDNLLTDSAAETLARSPAFAGLEILHLEDNHFGDDAAWELSQSRTLTALRRVGLAGNELTAAGRAILQRRAEKPPFCRYQFEPARVPETAGLS